MCDVDYGADIKALIEMMIQEQGPEKAGEVMMDLRYYLKVRINENHDIVRTILAKQTENQRYAKGTREWWVHMRHCYGLDYDSHWGPGQPTERYRCKYGEDDKCPAALYKDPWAAYIQAEEEEKSG